MEINFATLPKMAPVDYRLKLSIECENGTGLDLTTYKIGVNASPDGVRTLVHASLPDGFDTESLGSTQGLRIKSFPSSG